MVNNRTLYTVFGLYLLIALFQAFFLMFFNYSKCSVDFKTHSFYQNVPKSALKQNEDGFKDESRRVQLLSNYLLSFV